MKIKLDIQFVTSEKYRISNQIADTTLFISEENRMSNQMLRNFRHMIFISPFFFAHKFQYSCDKIFLLNEQSLVSTKWHTL